MAEPCEGESRRVWIFAALLTTGGWAVTAAYALYSYLHRIADGYVSPLPRCPHDGFGMGVIFRGSRIRAQCVGLGFLSDPRLRPLEGVNLKEIDAHHLAFLSADFPVAHPNATSRCFGTRSTSRSRE